MPLFRRTLLKIVLVFGAAAISMCPAHAQTVAYVANAVSNSVSVIDTSSNTVIATIPTGTAPGSVAALPDGSRVYVSVSGNQPNGGFVTVIDTATNTIVGNIPVTGDPGSLAVTPDGQRLYVTTSVQFFSPGDVIVIDTATNTVTGSPITVRPAPGGLAITPDGKHAYVGNNSGTGITLIDTTTNSVVIPNIPTDAFPLDLAVTPDGAFVYVANDNPFVPSVSVIATATNTRVATVLAPISPSDLAITPDGTHVYVSINNQNFLSIIDTATNTITGPSIPVGNRPAGLAITPDGKSVYVATSADNAVSVVDTATNTRAATIPVGSFPIALTIANVSTPFAEFTVDNLVIEKEGFHIQGQFAPGTNSAGIDPTQQPVTLAIGNFAFTIPAGSFVPKGNSNNFLFNGTVNGLEVNFQIRASQSSGFSYVVNVHNTDQTTQPNPVAVTLKIGRNSGTVTAARNGQ